MLYPFREPDLASRFDQVDLIELSILYSLEIVASDF